ncbi:MAG: hypothetical protein BJ554DRAFT_1208, partial [Olpidium bornovanus]
KKKKKKKPSLSGPLGIGRSVPPSLPSPRKTRAQMDRSRGPPPGKPGEAGDDGDQTPAASGTPSLAPAATSPASAPAGQGDHPPQDSRTMLNQVVNERNLLRSQNDQLWKCIAKQRKIIKQLQEDLQCAQEDNRLLLSELDARENQPGVAKTSTEGEEGGESEREDRSVLPFDHALSEPQPEVGKRRADERSGLTNVPPTHGPVENGASNADDSLGQRKTDQIFGGEVDWGLPFIAAAGNAPQHAPFKVKARSATTGIPGSSASSENVGVAEVRGPPSESRMPRDAFSIESGRSGEHNRQSSLPSVLPSSEAPSAPRTVTRAFSLYIPPPAKPPPAATLAAAAQASQGNPVQQSDVAMVPAFAATPTGASMVPSLSTRPDKLASAAGKQPAGDAARHVDEVVTDASSSGFSGSSPAETFPSAGHNKARRSSLYFKLLKSAGPHPDLMAPTCGDIAEGQQTPPSGNATAIGAQAADSWSPLPRDSHSQHVQEPAISLSGLSATDSSAQPSVSTIGSKDSFVDLTVRVIGNTIKLNDNDREVM